MEITFFFTSKTKLKTRKRIERKYGLKYKYFFYLFLLQEKNQNLFNCHSKNRQPFSNIAQWPNDRNDVNSLNPEI